MHINAAALESQCSYSVIKDGRNGARWTGLDYYDEDVASPRMESPTKKRPLK